MQNVIAIQGASFNVILTYRTPKGYSKTRSLYLWYVEAQVEQHLCGEDNTEVIVEGTLENFTLPSTKCNKRGKNLLLLLQKVVANRGTPIGTYYPHCLNMVSSLVSIMHTILAIYLTLSIMSHY